MDYNTFVARIIAVEQEPRRFFILDPEAQLPVYFGLNNVNQPTLLIEDVGEGFNDNIPPSTAQIRVTVHEQAGKVSLSFSLLSLTQREVFNLLCFDLFMATDKSSKEDALSSLLVRFKAWSDLLKGARVATLSVLQQQGLIAELLSIKYFSATRSPSEVLHAWCGPMGADKDFVFKTEWAEIKSCKIDETAVTITSLEQLDSRQRGTLYIYYIDKSTSSTDVAFSLIDIVQDVRTLFTTTSDKRIFDEKLALYGFSENEPAYAKHTFRLDRVERYAVQENFPKLSRDLLPDAIVSCSYKVNIPSLKRFQEEL